jgi:hypothetical protein
LDTAPRLRDRRGFSAFRFGKNRRFKLSLDTEE